MKTKARWSGSTGLVVGDSPSSAHLLPGVRRRPFGAGVRINPYASAGADTGNVSLVLATLWAPKAKRRVRNAP